MKVLLINGSPRKQGNTYTALNEIAQQLNKQGVESEIIWIGNKAVRGCIACGSCKENGDKPQTFSLKEPFRSEGWKQNVLRQQALRELPISLTKGSHTLSITALDNHIILDQWMLDFKTDRKAYMFPILPMLLESMN